MPDKPNICLALISSPRSGNTWIGNVLASALELEKIEVQNYLELGDIVPQRILLQTHCYREPIFRNG